MNFYEREQKAIIADEQDNQLLSNLFNGYSQLKQECHSLKLLNSQLNQQIQHLQQTNNTLQSEIFSLRQSKQREQEAKQKEQDAKQREEEANQTKSTNYLSKQINRLVFPQTLAPNMLNKTIERTLNTQQTKRRVINGFVDELSQELEQSEDLLRKQRIMQEETRRTLNICNEELASMRNTIKHLESQLTVLSNQNQQLLRELETVIMQRRRVEERQNANLMEYNKLKGNFMITADQFESQMVKMDSIYRSIEIQLEGTR